MCPPLEDEDREVVPIPLDRASIARLARLGRVVGRHPVAVAADLLRDLLEEDEQTNVLNARPALGGMN